MIQFLLQLLPLIVICVVFYLVGVFISKLWWPLRLIFICCFLIVILDRYNQASDYEKVFQLLIPSLCTAYPVVRKSLGYSPNLNPFSWVIEHYQTNRTMKLREKISEQERQKYEQDRELYERAERIQREQHEEAERQRQFERERAERERKEREQYYKQSNQNNKQEQNSKQEQNNKQSSNSNFGGKQNRTQAQDPYEVLGVTRDMSKAEIKKVYLKLMTQYAPDKVSHLSEEFQKMAHEKCVAFNAAWEKIGKNG